MLRNWPTGFGDERQFLGIESLRWNSSYMISWQLNDMVIMVQMEIFLPLLQYHDIYSADQFIGFKIVRAVKFSCVSEKYSLMVLFRIVRSKSLQLMIYPLGYFVFFSFYWGRSNCERGTFWKIAHNLLRSQFVIFFIVFEKSRHSFDNVVLQ